METDELRLAKGHVIPPAAIEEHFVTGGGPGGQNVNKVATKVELRLHLDRTGWPPAVLERIRSRLASRVNTEGVLVLQASEERTRERNRVLARTRLIALLDGALVVPKRRRASRPTLGSKRRRLEQKKQHGQKKDERSGRRESD